MGFYLSPSGDYHEGDLLVGDTAVAQRPDTTFKYEGGAWVVDSTKKPVLYDTGLGWFMKTTPEAQLLFAQMAATILTNQSVLTSTALATFNAASCPIQDSDGESHPELSMYQAQATLASYGGFCAQLWFTQNS